MENFQVLAYKSKKGGKFYLTLICIFVLFLLPMAIHLRQIFEAILFGVVGLSCIIYLIVKKKNLKKRLRFPRVRFN